MQFAESQQTQTRKGNSGLRFFFAGFAEVIRIDSKVVCICGVGEFRGGGGGGGGRREVETFL